MAYMINGRSNTRKKPHRATLRGLRLTRERIKEPKLPGNGDFVSSILSLISCFMNNCNCWLGLTRSIESRVSDVLRIRAKPILVVGALWEAQI